VARASAGYFFPAAFIVTLAIVAASLVVAYLLDRWWYDVKAWTFVASQLVAVACALVVLRFIPWVRIHLVPLRQRYRHAHDNAIKQFLGRNIHVTTARTGVLLFVSLAERYAEVVADAGINAKVDQATWDGVVVTLTSHAKKGEIADGFVEAIGVVGELLARHFPVGTTDVNELDDHVVEI
jgi:putative membrane protein